MVYGAQRRRGRCDSAARAYTRRDRLPERQSMSARFRVASLFLTIALVAPMMAIAQDEYVVDLSRIDPSAILASAGDVLMRAPDAAIDDLFQANNAAAQKPGEAKKIGRAQGCTPVTNAHSVCRL